MIEGGIFMIVTVRKRCKCEGKKCSKGILIKTFTSFCVFYNLPNTHKITLKFPLFFIFHFVSSEKNNVLLLTVSCVLKDCLCLGATV